MISQVRFSFQFGISFLAASILLQACKSSRSQQDYTDEYAIDYPERGCRLMPAPVEGDETGKVYRIDEKGVRHYQNRAISSPDKESNWEAVELPTMTKTHSLSARAAAGLIGIPASAKFTRLSNVSVRLAYFDTKMKVVGEQELQDGAQAIVKNREGNFEVVGQAFRASGMAMEIDASQITNAEAKANLRAVVLGAEFEDKGHDRFELRKRFAGPRIVIYSTISL